LAACGEPIRPPAPKKTLPFVPRPGLAEVGDAKLVTFEARIGEEVLRHEYTDVTLEASGGRAMKVRRGEDVLRWQERRFVDEKGEPRLSFEMFEQLLPPREGDSIPTTWKRSGVLAELSKLLPDHVDPNGGTAACEFEEVVVQKGKSEAWVAVRYEDAKGELTGRLIFDLSERMLSRVELRRKGLTMTTGRRVTTVR
jgi:hypothetical protein